MRLLSYGPRAVLAEFDSIDEVVATAAAWRAADLPGVVDIVPAAASVLITHDGALDAASLVPSVGPASALPGALVEVPVRYDGEDLAAVAALCRMSPDDVVALHSGTEYRAAFCGFMPGFTYLVGLDARLELARRSTPRIRVPAGSVAIAGGFTAVYPSQSPGGWHLLGRTEVPMWVDDRAVPATLPPGTRVRFVAT